MTKISLVISHMSYMTKILIMRLIIHMCVCVCVCVFQNIPILQNLPWVLVGIVIFFHPFDLALKIINTTTIVYTKHPWPVWWKLKKKSMWHLLNGGHWLKRGEIFWFFDAANWTWMFLDRMEWDPKIEYTSMDMQF